MIPPPISGDNGAHPTIVGVGNLASGLYLAAVELHNATNGGLMGRRILKITVVH